MSNEEQKVQHDTVTLIDSKVTVIDDKVTDFIRMTIKAGKILIPVFIGLVSAVVWIGYKAISINDWNNSLVKQPQFQAHEVREAKVDSALNAKVDTVNSRLNGRIDKMPKVSFVTEHYSNRHNGMPDIRGAN